jgi:hypothetical protein
MSPYETYHLFLVIKSHFTKPSYDVFKYNWKTRASIETYNRRKDRYFFERLSRKKTEQEIKEFFISNFVYTENPKGVYIPDLMKDGEEVYTKWRKYNQSLFYNFKTELEVFISHQDLNEFMECKNSQHSQLIKKYLQKHISLETLVILNKIFNFTKQYDKVLIDPVWENLSLRIKKYSPFLQINIEKYIQIMKETVCG